MKITIHTDGGARGNPGPAGAGAIIRDDEGNVLKEVSEFLGNQTNNFAEYEAAFLGLSAAKEIVEPDTAEVELYLDSELVVKQLKGEYKVKNEGLQPQYEKVKALLDMYPNIQFSHVRREENKDADKLANDAMDKGMNEAE